MTELESVQLRRSMTETMNLLHRYTDVRKHGETKELQAYEEMLAVWRLLFADPGDE
jgi:hypothetical protein